MEMPRGEDGLESEKPTETFGSRTFLGTHLTHAGDEEWDGTRRGKRCQLSLIVSFLFASIFWVYLILRGGSIYQCIAWETKTWSFREQSVGNERQEGEYSGVEGACAGSFAILTSWTGVASDSNGSNSRGLYGVPAIYPNESTRPRMSAPLPCYPVKTASRPLG